MARSRKNPVEKLETKKIRPALTPEAREQQLISLAIDLVEQRLLDGTATSQEVCHFLKLGSTKERLEKEIMAEQKELMKAKTQNLQSQKRVEELYQDAINAMKLYSGQSTGDSDEMDNYYEE